MFFMARKKNRNIVLLKKIAEARINAWKIKGRQMTL